MRKVRCPRCSAVITASGEIVKCVRCGLQGEVERPRPAPSTSSTVAAGAKGTNADAGDGKDPFVITLDLRKVSPKNWGTRTKVFAVFLLLAGAFFLGGMAGVAFEQARNEITEDLDRGESLLGGNQANSSGSTGTPGLEGPGGTGDGGEGGDGALDGTDGNSTGDPGPAGDSDPDDGSDPDNGSDPQPDGEPDPIEFSGTGDTTTADFQTNFSLLRFDLDHWGEDFFGVKVCEAGTSCTPSDGRVAHLTTENHGRYAGSRIIAVDPGDYYLQVGAKGGTWDITLTQPRPTDGTGLPVTRNGNGDAARGAFEFDSQHSVRFRASEMGQVSVKAYTSDGTPVEGCTFTTYLAQGEEYDETKACSVQDPALVFFDIVAPKDESSQTSWTLVIDG